MNESLYTQMRILAVFCFTGVIIGLLFDFFRIQRKVIKTHDIVTYIQDILFWIISGIIVIAMVVKYTNDEIRSYMILGLIVGVVTYFSFLSHYLMKISLRIVEILTSPFKKICKKFKKD